MNVSPTIERQLGRLVNEWSLSRAYSTFKQSEHSGFAILSAWRKGNSYATNRAATDSLKSELPPGYVQLIGHGQEDEEIDGRPTGKKVTSIEPSFWVNGVTRDDARELAARYKQDYYVYCGPETQGQVIVYHTSDNMVSQRMQGFHPERIADFYSVWKGSPFFFEEYISNWAHGVAVQSSIKQFVDRLLEHAEV